MLMSSGYVSQYALFLDKIFPLMFTLPINRVGSAPDPRNDLQKRQTCLRPANFASSHDSANPTAYRFAARFHLGGANDFNDHWSGIATGYWVSFYQQPSGFSCAKG